ncbi:MAG: hypothetical protein ABJF11_04700 [Reichenbachiella sp.]|uniref:hypothetical protein n=1 Tax=Reichenbachiella sp. TaxID=2184521 RepID=UPI0032652C17
MNGNQFITANSEEKIGQINSGLRDAAFSLQLVLNTPITFRSHYFNTEEQNHNPQYCSKKGKHTHLIKTKINGGLKGTCYLTFDSSELNRLCDICLSNELFEGHTCDNCHIKNDFIAELDNLIASTIISQMDNSWDQKTLSKTPTMYVLNGEEINKHILVDSIGLNCKMPLKTTFYAHEIGVALEFIFLFQNFQTNENSKKSLFKTLTR